jgi:hypothetical protein
MNRTRILSWTALPVIIVAVSLFAGCTTTANTVRIMPTVGMPAYPPTDPTTVMILRTQPVRPFETFGQVILEPESALSVPEMEQNLRQAAAGMGANAVVIISDMTMLAGSHRSEASGGQIISANAIRFKD